MPQLLQDHELVQGDKQVGQVDAERDFEPRFVVPAVGLRMVHCKREKHNEDADAGPHYLEELDALSLHLLLSSLHAEVLEPRPLHVHLALAEGNVPRRSRHASLGRHHLSSLDILLVLRVCWLDHVLLHLLWVICVAVELLLILLLLVRVNVRHYG